MLKAGQKCNKAYHLPVKAGEGNFHTFVFLLLCRLSSFYTPFQAHSVNMALHLWRLGCPVPYLLECSVSLCMFSCKCVWHSLFCGSFLPWAIRQGASKVKDRFFLMSESLIATLWVRMWKAIKSMCIVIHNSQRIWKGTGGNWGFLPLLSQS